MTLAPIRGAPPGAPIPGFPVEEPGVPDEPTAPPASGDQPTPPPIRRRHTPIEIGGDGTTVTFTVIPELPAIARASLIVQVVGEGVGRPGFLQMSAANARRFLTEIRNGCSSVVATGDENGTVQIEFEIAEPAPVLLVRRPGELHDLHRRVIDQGLDLKTIAAELLTDLGD